MNSDTVDRARPGDVLVRFEDAPQDAPQASPAPEPPQDNHTTHDRALMVEVAEAIGRGEFHPAVNRIITEFLRGWRINLRSTDLAAFDRVAFGPNLPSLCGTGPISDPEPQALALAVADWLVRFNLPTWLTAAGVEEFAKSLADLPDLIQSTKSQTVAATEVERAIRWIKSEHGGVLSYGGIRQQALTDAGVKVAAKIGKYRGDSLAFNMLMDRALDLANYCAGQILRDAQPHEAERLLSPVVRSCWASGGELIARMCAMVPTLREQIAAQRAAVQTQSQQHAAVAGELGVKVMVFVEGDSIRLSKSDYNLLLDALRDRENEIVRLRGQCGIHVPPIAPLAACKTTCGVKHGVMQWQIPK